MRVSQMMTRTQRETPAEADTVSHQLLLRSGMIHQIAAGVYAYLPLGWRSLRKLQQIVREELDAVGCQELMMPALHPIELWEKTGRHHAMGQILFSVVDRRERKLVLGPTHEEVITELARFQVRSYRDLPQLLYQIQTKFRDEPRPRGGLLRVREFDMMDLYSFDADWESLDTSYQKVRKAYLRIYDRCGLPTMMVEADSGAIGGKDSHEFMAVTDTGEDQIIYCGACKYAANLEKAQSVKPGVPREAPLPLEEVSTPGMKSIDEVSGFLKVPKSHTLKAVFYAADGRIVFVAIRGDLEVNEIKLKNALKCTDLRLATDGEVAGAGLVAGSASPLGLSGIKTVADDSVAEGINFVAGANRPDFHVKNVNYPRDFTVDLVLDVASAQAGPGLPEVRAGPGHHPGHRGGAHLQAGHAVQREDGRLLPGPERRAEAHRHGQLRHRHRPPAGDGDREEPRRQGHYLARLAGPVPGVPLRPGHGPPGGGVRRGEPVRRSPGRRRGGPLRRPDRVGGRQVQ